VARKLLIAGLGAAALAAVAAVPAAWKTHVLDGSLQVRYPPNWGLISKSPERLDIITGERAEGVVIGANAAEIILVVGAASLPAEKIVQATFRDMATVTRRTVKVPGPGHIPGCGTYMEVIGREEAGPNAYITNTGLFCRTASRDVTLLVRNWPDDKRQASYQGIGRMMIESIAGAVEGAEEVK
jgi:hypothetical protein